MRKAIITIALLAVAVSMSAQESNTKNYERKGDTFVQVQSEILPNDQVTAYKWEDAKGNQYPIILHTYTKGDKAGRTTCYVIRTSAKTGKEYRYFLPNGEEIAKEIINENE